MIKHKCHLYSLALCSFHPGKTIKCVWRVGRLCLKKDASIATTKKCQRKLKRSNMIRSVVKYCFELSKISHYLFLFCWCCCFQFFLSILCFTFSFSLTLHANRNMIICFILRFMLKTKVSRSSSVRQSNNINNALFCIYFTHTFDGIHCERCWMMMMLLMMICMWNRTF